MIREYVKKLIEYDARLHLTIREDMWHAYMLFGVKKPSGPKRGMRLISEVTSGIPQT